MTCAQCLSLVRRRGSRPILPGKIVRRPQHGPPNLSRVPHQTAGAEVPGGLGDQMANGLIGGRELPGAESPGSFPAPDARQGSMEVSHAGHFGHPKRKLRLEINRSRLPSFAPKECDGDAVEFRVRRLCHNGVSDLFLGMGGEPRRDPLAQQLALARHRGGEDRRPVEVVRLHGARRGPYPTSATASTVGAVTLKPHPKRRPPFQQ